jgi:hypothetical protein
MPKWETMILDRIQNINNYSMKLEGKRWVDVKKGDNDSDEIRLNELGAEGWQLIHVNTANEISYMGKGISNHTTYYLVRQIED